MFMLQVLRPVCGGVFEQERKLALAGLDLSADNGNSVSPMPSTSGVNCILGRAQLLLNECPAGRVEANPRRKDFPAN